MKVVLLQDWLTGYRGGERVLDAICELFPKAPLYTLIHVPGSTSPLIEDRKIVQSFLGSIPGIEKHYRKFLPLMPFAAESLKITEEADVVISTSHCVIKGVPKPRGSKHLSYIHSPMRYIYDQFPVYFNEHTPLLQRLAAHAMRPMLATWDKASNQNVDRFIANSFFVRDRIKTYYGEESGVIHPFVDLSDFPRDFKSKEDFYLMVTAFAPNKKVDLAILAFNKMAKPLYIVGSGQEEARLRSIAGPTIKFLGSLPRAEIVSLYSQARGFVFPGVEDFGITPLEANAAGTALIAYKIGGVLETQTDKTCQFFTEQNVSSLIDAVSIFENRIFNQADLRANAEKFSRAKFQKEIMRECEGLLSKMAPTCQSHS
jgi:glycosyltransferase involved in cell wall biosynthesis